MTRAVAISLKKGGVGKTTTAVNLAIKEKKPKAVNTANGKAVLEKWSIYVNSSYKRTLKIYATKNNKKEYSVIGEALKEYIEKRKIKD